MTFEQAQEVLARITYKPGWKIALADIGIAKCSITYNAPDANNPERPASIRFEQSVELVYLNEKQFIDWLFVCVRAAEIHEMEEWFKIDGHCFCAPHK